MATPPTDSFVDLRRRLLAAVKRDAVASGVADADADAVRRWFDLVYDVCWWRATDRPLADLMRTYDRALAADDPARAAYTDPEVLADIEETYAEAAAELRWLLQQLGRQLRLRGLRDGEIEQAITQYHREVIERPLE